jgi:hypothetical protein
MTEPQGGDSPTPSMHPLVIDVPVRDGRRPARNELFASLGTLEHRLRELEAELSAIGDRGVPAIESLRSISSPPPSVASPPPSVAPGPPPIDAGAPASATTPVPPLDELLRFRERLADSTQAIVEEYRRLTAPLAALAERAPTGPREDAAAPVASVPAGPREGAETPVESVPQEPVGPPPLTHAAVPHPGEDGLYQGSIEINAGPFGDLSTLGAFERTVAGLVGVSTVFVRSFEGSRAVIDLEVPAPLTLLSALHEALPTRFTVMDTSTSRIAILLTPTPSDLPPVDPTEQG